MTSSFTEGQHAGEFMVSHAVGMRSFETAQVKSGQNLKAGQVVQLNGAELVAFTGLLNSNGALSVQAVGIMHTNVDATGGAVADCVYVARDAEVNGNELIYASNDSNATADKTVAIASLKLLGIIVR